jgi:FG-GAP repeat/FG-GAP-like repeat
MSRLAPALSWLVVVAGVAAAQSPPVAPPNPLLTPTFDWTVAGGDGDDLGNGLGTAGDVNGDGYSDVILGAANHTETHASEGAAHVYLGSATGLATTPAWTVFGQQDNAYLGFSVGTAGDVDGDGFCDVIVGVRGFSNGQSNEGQARVYLGSASGLATTAAWSVESNQADAAMGYSVATAGDVNGDGFSDVVVGTPFYSGGQTNEGRVGVYLGSASGLSTSPSFTFSSNQADAELGYAVASAGDVNGDGFSDVIASAPDYDFGQPDEGRAWVFLGAPGGTTAAGAWTAESNQASAFFGNAVGTAGDVNGDGYSDVIVAADHYDDALMEQGRVFVYLGGASGLATTESWAVEGDEIDAQIGNTVCAAGDVDGDGYCDVLVGDSNYDNGSFHEGGRNWLYLGSALGLGATAAYETHIDDDFAFFGFVATAGDVNGDGLSDFLITAPAYGTTLYGQGVAYAWYGAADTLRNTATWSPTGTKTQDDFGLSVASAGDVDGDGNSDVLVGADRFADPLTAEGATWLYLGATGGLSASPAWTEEGDSASANFGHSVAGAGDVNGDGFADVLVGAPGFSNGNTGEGEAVLYLGSASGLATTPAWTVEGNANSAGLGQCVACAGDVDGDGFLDVVVGSLLLHQARLYLGNETGLATSPAATLTNNQPASNFGTACAGAGDVNGDGFSDVIVGAPNFSAGQSGEGRAYVYLGSVAGLPTTPAWTMESNQAGAGFGTSVATAGDSNADGYSDVVVGAPGYDGAFADAGRVFVFRGGSGGLETSGFPTLDGDQAGEDFGISVATAGDANGDGHSDLLVGADLADHGQTDEGRAFLFHGQLGGPASAAIWDAESNDAFAQFGVCVAPAGDVNGDGYGDALVGASLLDGAASAGGGAFVYLGNHGPCVPERPRQRKADNSGPLAPLDRVADSFRARLLMRSPFGREKATLAVEAKGNNLFNGQNLTLSAPTDTGTNGAAGNLAVTGLDPNKTYRWRARIQHDRAAFPWLPAGPWYSIADNAPT